MTVTKSPAAISHSPSGAIGAAAVLGAAALWGTAGPAQVLASSGADPGALGVARLLVGGFVLSMFCPKIHQWRQALSPGVIGWVLLAALATGVYQITFMHAVDQIGAALGTAIALGVAPAATGLCARWWTHERLTPGWMIGTAAALVGCAVLLNPWAAESPTAAGVAFALVSGICYGVYTVAAKRFLQAGAPALPATAITLIVSGFILSPLIWMHPHHLTDPDSLMLIAWLGLACTAAAYTAFTFGLHRTTAPVAGTLSLAEPLLAVALGVLIIQEQLTTSTLIGGTILIVGLAAVTTIDGLRRRSAGPASTRDAQ